MTTYTQLSPLAVPGETYSFLAKEDRGDSLLMALYPNPKFFTWDDNGKPLDGGKLYTYYAGTTTPKTTYSDYELTEANTNPIILDARGEATSIFGTARYKFVLKDENDVELWTMDNVMGLGCCSSVLAFDDDDLDASGAITIAHDYEVSWLRVTVYNDAGLKVIPEYVDSSVTTQIIIGFGNMTLNGTWHVRYGV